MENKIQLFSTTVFINILLEMNVEFRVNKVIFCEMFLKI